MQKRSLSTSFCASESHAGLKVSTILCHWGAFFSEICLQSSILGLHLNSIDSVTLEGASLRKTQTFLPKSRSRFHHYNVPLETFGSLHKAQNCTLDSMGCMDCMKLQDKGLNAPAVRTIMGAVQIICLRWKKEAPSP